MLRHIDEHPFDIAQLTSDEFGIPKRVVNARLKQMAAEGKLVQSGKGKTLSYLAAMLVSETIVLPVTPSLDETTVWVERIQPLLKEIPPNVLSICQYGFTEMLNNVVDHSGSADVRLHIMQTTSRVSLRLADRGVGIFRKIQQALGLEDERLAILELGKGKFTTDPERHSGQGIFFTSKVVDTFVIVSGSIAEDYGFTKTIIPVSLARIGDEHLISRSQAKRLLARIEQFKEVMLNFDGVTMIGQAFADEIFRVFQNQHPEVKLTWSNAVPDVERMILWAKATRTG